MKTQKQIRELAKTYNKSLNLSVNKVANHLTRVFYWKDFFSDYWIKEVGNIKKVISIAKINNGFSYNPYSRYGTIYSRAFYILKQLKIFKFHEKYNAHTHIYKLNTDIEVINDR